MQKELFVLDDLRLLLKHEEEWCVSLYMPAHRVTTGVQEDQIRFKNLIREVEEQLSKLKTGDSTPSLEQAYKLAEDRPFWHHQSDGLALFISRDHFQPYRLPLKFKELVVVTDRFHVKPLIPFLSGDGHFYVLALSQNNVRLLQCTRFGESEMTLEGVPDSLDEALKYDEQEKQLQLHTGSPQGPGKRAALFHGQGVGTDDAKDRILRYFQQIDRGLNLILANDRAPMVVAAVDYLLPIFQRATTYPNVLEHTIPGNPETIQPQELREKGWELVAPHFEQELHHHIAAFAELSGTDRQCTSVEDVVKRAFHGRVEVAFVSLGVQVWGLYHPSTDEVTKVEEWQPGTMDLLDFAAAQTLLNGGVVYALEPEQMPEGGLSAAILRY